MKLSATDFRELSPEEAPEVVIFDLWRTTHLSLDREPILDLQEIFGHNLQVVDGHLRAQVDPDFLRVCLTTNLRDPKQFLNHVAGFFGYTVSEEALRRFQAILDRESLNLARYEDVDETIAGLKARGYRLGVISNLWAFPESRIFGDSGFGDNFEHRIYSFEVGHRKPDQEIFHEAVKRFGVEPAQCLMVGDHPEADVKGALKVGMRAALIDRPGEFRGNIPGVRVMRTLTELLDLPTRTRSK